MAKYKPMPRREEGSAISNANGVTFGQMIKILREKCGISLRKASVKIGISPTYLSDLENDKRYPPVGEVLNRILKTYKVDEEQEYEIMELIGLGREELAPDMAEYLRKSEMARKVIRKLMKIDNLDKIAIDHEDEVIRIYKAIDKPSRRRK